MSQIYLNVSFDASLPADLFARLLAHLANVRASHIRRRVRAGTVSLTLYAGEIVDAKSARASFKAYLPRVLRPLFHYTIIEKKA